ncbi:MAG: M14 family metallopeptidase [Isosphaeraceae bacterium]
MPYEFPADYLTARHQFRTLAAERGARLEAFAIKPVGPDGEPLTIDIALLGDERPARVVVVSSGLHGVEAPLGSAVQAAWLSDPNASGSLPPGAAVVLLHALNPFGFAWSRRVNEGNVDLNRNAVNQGEVYQGCPARYAELDGLLNPRRPPRLFDSFLFEALRAQFRYGLPAVKQAIAGGQYEYPLGLFFGGNERSRTVEILAEGLPRWVGDAEHIVHIDIHTGLGRWATCRLLLNDVEPPKHSWLAEGFGVGAFESPDPRGTAYETRGDLLNWCGQSLFPDRRYDGLCAEFGTYPGIVVLTALRAENQGHHWGDPDARACRLAKRLIREAFSPASPRWRAATTAHGLAIIHQAIAACFPSKTPAHPAPGEVSGGLA